MGGRFRRTWAEIWCLILILAQVICIQGKETTEEKSDGPKKEGQSDAPVSSVSVSAYSYSVTRKIEGKPVLKKGKLRPAFGGYETAVRLRFVPPEGSGIVSIEDASAKIESFIDSEGKVMIARDGSDATTKSGSILNAAECRMEITVPALASANATKLFVKGTVPVNLAGGTNTFRSGPIDKKTLKKKGGVELKLGQTKVSASAHMNGTRFVIALVTLVPEWQSVHRFQFFDTKGKELKSIPNGNWGKLEDGVKWKGLSFGIPDYESVVIVMEQWKDVKRIDVPFECEIPFGPEDQPEVKAKEESK